MKEIKACMEGGSREAGGFTLTCSQGDRESSLLDGACDRERRASVVEREQTWPLDQRVQEFPKALVRNTDPRAPFPSTKIQGGGPGICFSFFFFFFPNTQGRIIGFKLRNNLHTVKHVSLKHTA